MVANDRCVPGLATVTADKMNRAFPLYDGLVKTLLNDPCCIFSSLTFVSDIDLKVSALRRFVE